MNAVDFHHVVVEDVTDGYPRAVADVPQGLRWHVQAWALTWGRTCGHEAALRAAYYPEPGSVCASCMQQKFGAWAARKQVCGVCGARRDVTAYVLRLPHGSVAFISLCQADARDPWLLARIITREDPK